MDLFYKGLLLFPNSKVVCLHRGESDTQQGMGSRQNGAQKPQEGELNHLSGLELKGETIGGSGETMESMFPVTLSVSWAGRSWVWRFLLLSTLGQARNQIKFLRQPTNLRSRGS